MNTTLTTSDLPANLQNKVQRICKQERIDQDQVRFVRRNPNYYQMNEADQWTGWGYFPNENEID